MSPTDRRRPRDRDHAAYTLAETLVSLGLGMLILGPLLAIWIGSSRAEKSLQARLDLFKSTSEVMGRVCRDVLASGGLRTVAIEGTSDSRVGLITRGGKAVHYGLDGEGKKLMRHVRDLFSGEDVEAEPILAHPATVGLWDVPGGAIRIRVTLDEGLVLTTSLCPRGW